MENEQLTQRQQKPQEAIQDCEDGCISEYETRGKDTGSLKDHFDFTTIGPGIIFVNEVHTFPVEERMNLAPLVKRYVLIKRDVQRSLAAYSRYMDVEKRSQSISLEHDEESEKTGVRLLTSRERPSASRRVHKEAELDHVFHATTQSQSKSHFPIERDKIKDLHPRC